ncbi:hypothetical protein [Alkalibacterium sp. 20]|uniref:hypothetical protein n=1 Tax=Alkalibacterium sp. 20 TaxID=1798803 RepID=UPI0008FFF763|nr:hypothetical protein [Alkalibacterium sp. 20]OJF97008.1 hypothetical protein AX762_00125 [Alkalibacterium sp. 20]
MAKDMEKFQRMVQKFLNEHGDEFDSPVEAVGFFTRMYNEEIKGGKNFVQSETKETRSMDKLEEAQSVNSLKRMKQLIEEAIGIWPENWDAHSMLIDYSPAADMSEIIEQYKFLEKRAHKDWHKNTERGGYLHLEERPYLRIKAKLGFLYMEAGMLDHALDHLLELYKIDESDALGTRYKIMSLYLHKFDWKQAWRFYSKVEGADEDDQLLILIIIMAVLTDHTDLAKNLLEKLIAVNADVEKLFLENMWPIEDFYDDELNLTESYQPYSYQSLLITLQDILYVIIENEYLFKWLKRETLKLLPNERKATFSHQPFSGYIDPFESNGEDIFFAMRKDASNPLRSLSYERAGIFYNNDLTTYEDFAELSEKEVLKLKGIGPVTIKELKASGVTFKK